ncbi:hypothetical protein [Streptomyces phyllanthi]|uniref:hypothetical protein n=1 Tax=Streptomyces phyllanthi TaxID=1803180 RepID=UPI003CD08C4F
MNLQSGRHGRHRASWPRRGGPRARRARLVALAGLAVAAIALPLAVASAGPLGDAGRAVARVSGLADERARAAESGSRDGEARHDGTTWDAASGDGKVSGEEWPAYESRTDESRGDESRTDESRGGESRGGESRGGEEGPVGETGGAEAQAPSRSPLSLGIGLATATRCGAELTSPDGIEAQTCVLTQGEETWARTYYRNATGEELSLVLSLMSPDGHSVRMHCLVGAQDEPGVCETPKERAQGGLEAYTAVAEFASSSGRGPLLLRAGSNSPGGQVG